MPIMWGGGSNLETLRYRTEAIITAPHIIELRGDMLTWRVRRAPAWDHHLAIPIRSCLSEFSRLSSATPEQVHMFAQKRGVLALTPIVEQEQEDGQKFLRYTEPVYLYTRLGGIVRRLLAVINHITQGKPLTKGSRCLLPDISGLAEMVLEEREELECIYGLLCREDYTPETMRFALTEIVQDFWNASPPRLSTGANPTHLPGLWVCFAGCQAAVEQWDKKRLWSFRPPLSVMVREKRSYRAAFTQSFIDYRDYAQEFVQMLPNMKGTRHSPLLSVLAFQLMEAITLPTDTFYCKQCQAEFQPAPGRNAPRADHGGCCSEECAILWKRAYNKRRYQQRRNDRQAAEKISNADTSN